MDEEYVWLNCGQWMEWAEGFRKPWSEPQIETDLLVWDALARGKKPRERPGRIRLAERWGVTEKQARRMMEAHDRATLLGDKVSPWGTVYTRPKVVTVDA